VNKQVLIVGLGRFGMSLVRALDARGVEILAVDRSPERVDQAAAHAAEAIALDASVEEELRRTRPADRDLCICAIGDESSEASILCTALLRQLGAKRIVARANSQLQARILKLVGAHEVINPLEDFGMRFADQFAFERLKGELPLGGDLVIAEIVPPDDFLGKTLAELRLPSRFSLTVVATRKGEEGEVQLPSPEQRIGAGDIMVVVARKSAVVRFLRKS
jgi:trk system potassium uptake protein